MNNLSNNESNFWSISYISLQNFAKLQRMAYMIKNRTFWCWNSTVNLEDKWWDWFIWKKVCNLTNDKGYFKGIGTLAAYSASPHLS